MDSPSGVDGDVFCRYVTWTNDSGAFVCHAAAATTTTTTTAAAAAAVCTVDKSSGVLCARLGLTCRCICGHSLARHAASASAADAPPPPPPISSAAVTSSSSHITCSSIPSSAPPTAPSFSRCIQCACARFSYMYPCPTSALPIRARNTELAAEPQSLDRSTGTRI